MKWYYESCFIKEKYYLLWKKNLNLRNIMFWIMSLKFFKRNIIHKITIFKEFLLICKNRNSGCWEYFSRKNEPWFMKIQLIP